MFRLASLPSVFFVSCLVCLGNPAFAHHGDESGNLGNIGNGPMIETGSALELGHGDSPQILVGVSIPGWDAETGDHHVFYRYFWVSFRGFIRHEGDPAGVMPSLGVNITPVSRIRTSHSGVTTSLRIAPIEVRRDVAAGIGWSASIQALGFAASMDRPWNGEDPTFEKFARIAVDLIGWRVGMTGAQGGAESENAAVFQGAQLGTVQTSAGLRWNLDREISLQLALGGRGGAAVGGLAGRTAWISEVDAFSQIQLLLAEAFVPLSLRLEGGYHLFGISTGDDVASSGAHEHLHPHGHFYLALSIGVFFQ